MSINIVAPQPASFNPSAPLVELETQLRTAVACADASNKTAAALILHMIEQRQQSVRSIARTVGKSPSWVHAMLTWARDDFQDDPFSRSKRVQPAEQPEPEPATDPDRWTETTAEEEAEKERLAAEAEQQAEDEAKPEPEANEAEASAERRKAENAAAWPEPEPDSDRWKEQSIDDAAKEEAEPAEQSKSFTAFINACYHDLTNLYGLELIKAEEVFKQCLRGARKRAAAKVAA